MYSYRRRVHRGVPESTASPDSVADRNAASVATQIPPHQGRALYMAGIRAIQRAEAVRQAETGAADISAAGSQDSRLPGTVRQGAHENGPAQRQESAREDPTAPIQAKMGFEFETGWLVDRIPFDYTHDDVEQPAQDPVPFEKMAVVTTKTFDGFRMEADEAEGGRSEIEFVIRPPIEENLDGLEMLNHVMTGMEDIAGRLVANRGERASWPLSEVTHEPFDDFVLVTPRDETLRAGIQPTMGLLLEKVPDMLPEKKHLSDFPKFNGFLNLVKRYVLVGSKNQGEGTYPLAYPKMIAEPLLARTNFAGLLQLVEPEALELFHDHEAWVDGVLTAIDMMKLKNTPLLDRGVILGDQDEFAVFRERKRTIELMELDQARYSAIHLEGEKKAAAKRVEDVMARKTGGFNFYSETQKQKDLTAAQHRYEELLLHYGEAEYALHQLEKELDNLGRELQARLYTPELTVAGWLSGIFHDVDHLTSLKDAESMGQFKSKTEAVGPDRTQGGIFEFRGMQSVKKPYTAWKETAMDFFKRILGLHGH